MTVASPASFDGVGLFTAVACEVTVQPASAGNGITFASDTALIPAHHSSLTQAPGPGRCTCLAGAGASVSTVEHLLSALVGLGVTDATIRVNGPEIPILDGSSAPFAEQIETSNLHDAIEPLRLDTGLCVKDGDAMIEYEPADSCQYEYRLDYGPGAPIAPQTAMWSTNDDYSRIAPARTFCLESEAVAMRKAGLFAHLEPRDLLVIGPSGPIDTSYRLETEPAKHKLIDLVGDLSLVGRPIAGRFTATRSGHTLNHAMAGALLAAWDAENGKSPGPGRK